jgi:hypothetical protein
MPTHDYENYNREWLWGAARLLQIKGEPIPEALQKRADKLGLDVRLFSYEKENDNV